MPVRKNRVTRWTDDRGNVLEAFSGLAAQNALKQARDAGMPVNLLHKAGWAGDENDITGLFTDLVYRLLELPLHGPVDMSDANQVISSMVAICKSSGVDYREAIDFSHPKFIRSWREHNARVKANEWPSVEDDGLDMFGAPSGPGHDGHGHGLSNGHWCCFEDSQ
jgi:hypothetical protein